MAMLALKAKVRTPLYASDFFETVFLPFLTTEGLPQDIEVVVVDINQARIDAWNSDKLPIYEPGTYLLSRPEKCIMLMSH